jgi:hypothetical protein
MRKVDGAPLAVVELLARRLEEVAGLGEYPIASVAEVLRRVAGMPEMESPSKVQQKPLAGAEVGAAGVVFRRPRRWAWAG